MVSDVSYAVSQVLRMKSFFIFCVLALGIIFFAKGTAVDNFALTNENEGDENNENKIQVNISY